MVITKVGKRHEYIKITNDDKKTRKEHITLLCGCVAKTGIAVKKILPLYRGQKIIFFIDLAHQAPTHSGILYRMQSVRMRPNLFHI